MYILTDLKKSKLKAECDFQYSRSSGPGGQKVNKTETRVELHWDLLATSLFNSNQKAMIGEKLKNRLNKAGVLIYASEKHRTRIQNKNLSFRNLCDDLAKALTRPKVRKKTKPTRSSVEKRIQEKKKLSDKKKMRKNWD